MWAPMACSWATQMMMMVMTAPPFTHSLPMTSTATLVTSVATALLLQLAMPHWPHLQTGPWCVHAIELASLRGRQQQKRQEEEGEEEKRGDHGVPFLPS